MQAPAKTVYTLQLGDAVKGQYHGHEFSGIITYRRLSTVNRDEVIFYIELDAPVEVFGEERESVCMALCDHNATQRNFNNCKLYL